MLFPYTRLFLLVATLLGLTACDKTSNTASSSVETPPAATQVTTNSTNNSKELPELAKKHDCHACHSIDKKKVGPAWKDIANKYKNQPDAAQYLDRVIERGSKLEEGKDRYVWGKMPMPPNHKLTAQQRKELVAFILSLANR